MTLKVGDRIRRNGSNVASWAPLGYETVVTKGLTYTDIDGDEGVSINPDDWDLITEGPVRTVTRTVTEIVPGEYDQVRVGETDPEGFVMVAVGHSEPLSPWTATELKAAAAVLLELAGALDSE